VLYKSDSFNKMLLNTQSNASNSTNKSNNNNQSSAAQKLLAQKMSLLNQLQTNRHINQFSNSMRATNYLNLNDNSNNNQSMRLNQNDFLALANSGGSISRENLKEYYSSMLAKLMKSKSNLNNNSSSSNNTCSSSSKTYSNSNNFISSTSNSSSNASHNNNINFKSSSRLRTNSISKIYIYINI
jgi:hypothetical protein